MRANELLLWLSARHEGSWRQFRAAIEELHDDDADASQGAPQEDDGFPLHQILRLNLERLGHVEFFAKTCEEGWRVTPPTIAATKADGRWRGVLCGARSPNVLERFQRAANGKALHIAHTGAPDAWSVSGGTQAELLALARDAKIGFQSDAPLALLSHLSAVPIASKGADENEFPLGRDWTVQAFDSGDLCWRSATHSDAESVREGFFRFKIAFQRPRHFLRDAGRAYELPRAFGLYVFLYHKRRRRIVVYDDANRRLTVPGVCRPPSLIERALVLCSGLAPEFDSKSGRIMYRGIPRDIARLTARLLHQQLA